MFRLYKVKNLRNGIVKSFKDAPGTSAAVGKGYLPDETKAKTTRYQCDIPESRTQEWFVSTTLKGSLNEQLYQVWYHRYGVQHREDGPAYTTYQLGGVESSVWYLYGNRIDTWEEYQMWTECEDSRIVALKLKFGGDEIFGAHDDFWGI